MTSRTAVISRIKKMLARAAGTDSIHEAESARRLARELSEAHDIEDSETRESGDGEAVLEGPRFGEGWRMHLVRAICRPLGLVTSRKKKRKRGYELTIRGKLDDAREAHVAYLHLERAIVKLAVPPAQDGYFSSYLSDEEDMTPSELLSILAGNQPQWEYDFRLGVATSAGMRWKAEIIRRRGSKPIVLPVSRGPGGGGGEMIHIDPPASKTAFQLGVDAGNSVSMPPEIEKRKKRPIRGLLERVSPELARTATVEILKREIDHLMGSADEPARGP